MSVINAPHSVIVTKKINGSDVPIATIKCNNDTNAIHCFISTASTFGLDVTLGNIDDGYVETDDASITVYWVKDVEIQEMNDIASEYMSDLIT